MDYISQFLNQNITFNGINQDEAIHILQNKYSYYKLMSFTSVFQKYQKGEKKGKVVHADFSQLYYLAEIDFRLGQILMELSLEIELRLKARLTFDAEKICDTEAFFLEYYNSDREYLDHIYTPDNMDFLKSMDLFASVDRLSFSDFLNIAQFGTLVKMIHFFYKKYATELYHTEFASFENHLDAVRRIRNLVAHNNSIIDKIPIKCEYKDVKLLAFLGNNGIAHQTLTNNMSKALISDLCGFFEVYFDLIKENDYLLNLLCNFDREYCQKYKEHFEKNDLLKSSYRFFKEVLKIFLKKEKNT